MRDPHIVFDKSVGGWIKDFTDKHIYTRERIKAQLFESKHKAGKFIKKYFDKYDQNYLEIERFELV